MEHGFPPPEQIWDVTNPADGSVRFVSQSIDPQVLKSLTTIAGGEPLPPDWDR